LLEDDRGWHKYPPSSKFKQDDEVGISGTKTFEMVVSPNENKQSLPVLAFSYFDPAKEQYVTLHSEPTAITVQGGAAAPAVAAQPPGSSPATAARGGPTVSKSGVGAGEAIPNREYPHDLSSGLTVLGPQDASLRGGAISFEIDGIHPHDVSQVLDSRGIAVRAGHHCAKPAHKRFGVQSSTRMSSYLYTTPAEIDALVEGLEYAKKYFKVG
jgi:hypothetical protein